MPKTRLFLAAAAMAAGVGVAASHAQPSTSMPTRDFVQAAAASDQYEIQAARVAEIEGRDPQVRAYAQRMLQDHMKTRRSLLQAAQASGLPPPPAGLDDTGAKFLSELQSVQGSDFDRAYVRQQVLAHHSALVIDQMYAASGSDANVRNAAQAATSIVEHHLQQAAQITPTA